jgi:hypothetical protein
MKRKGEDVETFVILACSRVTFGLLDVEKKQHKGKAKF